MVGLYHLRCERKKFRQQNKDTRELPARARFHSQLERSRFLLCSAATRETGLKQWEVGQREEGQQHKENIILFHNSGGPVFIHESRPAWSRAKGRAGQ
jgi:hypothetical protein